MTTSSGFNPSRRGPWFGDRLTRPEACRMAAVPRAGLRPATRPGSARATSCRRKPSPSGSRPARSRSGPSLVRNQSCARSVVRKSAAAHLAPAQPERKAGIDPLADRVLGREREGHHIGAKNGHAFGQGRGHEIVSGGCGCDLLRGRRGRRSPPSASAMAPAATRATSTEPVRAGAGSTATHCDVAPGWLENGSAAHVCRRQRRLRCHGSAPCAMRRGAPGIPGNPGTRHLRPRHWAQARFHMRQVPVSRWHSLRAVPGPSSSSLSPVFFFGPYYHHLAGFATKPAACSSA
jgi:hypothetical protein